MQGLETRINTITIDGKQYQVPEGVVSAITRLENELEAEREAHKKTQKKFDDFMNLNQEKIVERIVTNLAHGMKPLNVRSSFGASIEKFDKNETCLAHKLYFYQKTDSAGEPLYEFKAEVEMRIRQALNGLTINGDEYK